MSANCMDVPVCPDQPGGWTCMVFHDQNISWKVIAKRGKFAAIHVNRLSQEEVRNFNIAKYLLK